MTDNKPSWIFGSPATPPAPESAGAEMAPNPGLTPPHQVVWPPAAPSPAPDPQAGNPQTGAPQAVAPPKPARMLATQNPAVAELEMLIRARYPLIEIISWEEERVIRRLGAIAAELHKSVWQWTINSGLCHWRNGLFTPGEGAKGTKDPLVALKEIAINSGDPTIYVLKDFHHFMRDPNVLRALRDLAATLRSTYTTVVLLGPRLELPPELEKDLTVVDFPLPDREEMGQFFDMLAEDIAENPDLQFEDNEATRQKLTDAAAGLTMNEVENVFAKILVRHGRLTAAEAPEVYHEKSQIIRKTGLLEYLDPSESIESIGGLRTLKEWLRKRNRAFAPQARSFGLPAPKGVLFLGIQGCGKSLCAKAVSRFWQMPLLRLDMGALFAAEVGASEANIRQAIRIAESVAPVILWIDEIDKGFAGVTHGADVDAGTASRVFGSFLTWLQEKTSPVFVIATANNVEVLPPELLRQGRFDEIFFVDLPTVGERREIFRIHLAQRRRDPARFDLDALARASEGYSGAEIEQAVISGLYDAFDLEQDVNQEILLGALRATRPLSALMAEEIARRRKWAEGRTRPAA